MATLTFRASSTYDTESASGPVIPAPSGLIDGDLIFAVIRHMSISGLDPTTVPSGWNYLGRDSMKRTYAYWKVADNEPSSWTWVWPVGTFKIHARAYAFYGDFDSENPIQSSAWTNFDRLSGSSSIVIPSLTTSSDNTVSVLFPGAYYNTAVRTFTPPSGWTEHDDSGAYTSDYWSAVASREFSAADTVVGDQTYMISGSSTYRVGIHVLVNPAAPAPTIPGKRWTGSAWTDLTICKRWTGTEWLDATITRY